jgi:hypothetical protein
VSRGAVSRTPGGAPRRENRSNRCKPRRAPSRHTGRCA